MKRKIIDETENLLVNDSTGSSSVRTLEEDLIYSMQETNGFSPKEFSDVENKNNSNGVILEQDRFLPIANINRIMKNVIPREGKLSKEAKECVQECVTEFLLFVTSEASERCAMEKRKTITGEDLLLAFQTLGFDDYVEPLREFLQKYREANKMQQTAKDETTDNLSISSAQPPHCYNINTNENPVTLTQIQETPSYNLTPTTSTSTSNSFTTVNKEMDETQKVQQLIMPNTLQPMQMYFDPVASQHYVAVQAADGTQTLLPVNLIPATQPQQPQTQAKSIAENPTNVSTLPTNSSRRSRNLNTFNNIPNGEQSVRHYLQSQEFKRKAANKSGI